jgi:AraC family transcriptional regulator
MSRLLPPGSFYGESQGSRRAGGFTLCESRYAPGERIPTHKHEYAFFYFVLRGSSTENFGGRARVAAAGTLVFHPAGESHANHWHAAGHCLHLELAPATVARAREFGAALDRPAEFRGGWPAWLAGRLYHELAAADAVAPLALEGLALELLAEVSRPAGVSAREPSPRWLRAARDFLHAHFVDQVSLAEAAAAAGVHPSHLARVFRREAGCSVGEYVRALRVDFACRELAGSDRPLAQIAVDAGFTDQSHLTRCVRQRTGLTPAAFRRRFGAGTSDPEP